MDAALAASIAELVKMGLAGVVIIGLAIAVYTLYKANAKLQDDRFTAVMTIMQSTTTALVKASESMDNSAEAIKGMQTVLMGLVAELQARRR